VVQTPTAEVQGVTVSGTNTGSSASSNETTSQNSQTPETAETTGSTENNQSGETGGETMAPVQPVQNEVEVQGVQAGPSANANAAAPAVVTVCHLSAEGVYQPLSVPETELNDHVAQGDVLMSPEECVRGNTPPTPPVQQNAANQAPVAVAYQPAAAPSPTAEVQGVKVPGTEAAPVQPTPRNLLVSMLPSTGEPALDLALLGLIPGMLAGIGLAITRLAGRRRQV
jgi:hypothetical protein